MKIYELINPLKPPAPDDLKIFRKALDLTIQQCADLVHVNKSSWCRWESTEETIMAPMSMMAWDLFMHKTRNLRHTLARRVEKLESKVKKA